MGKIVKTFVITLVTILVAQEFSVLLGVKGAAISFKLALATATALTALSTLATVLSGKKPVRATSITEQRLNKQIDPEAPRKMVFGNTIAPVDLRYWETYGTDNTKYDEVIVVATHEIESFGDFYLESQKYTFDGSGNSNILGAAFNRTTRTVGVTGTSLPVGVGVKWTTTSSMTGMAFYVLKYIYSQKDWPQGFPNRITQVIKGAKVYDPRLDSTVPGGTGTHRIGNQATWQYNDGITDIGRNPALQALWYLLGWKINGELVAGMGVETNSINLQGFIQAANDAETQGFFSDCALSTGDTHETNIGVIESSCSGRLLDPGGLYTFKVAIDDTANIAVALDENDIIGGFEWVPSKKLRDQANIINGQYIDPGSLYQPRSFPEVRDATFIANDGFKRRANNVYAAVQDPAQAQKLAWIQLKETRFQGVFKAPFNYRAFQAVNWDVITLSLPQYNFVNKLFRIIAYELSTEGAISLTLEETDPSIYVSGAVANVPAASVGSAYNARERIAIGSPAVVAVAVNSDGVDTQDGLKVTYTLPSTNVKWVEILYKRSADTIFIATSNVPGTESSYIIASLSPNTSYDVKLRTVSISNVPGNYTSVIVTTTGNNSVTAFSNVGGANKPQDNASANSFTLVPTSGITVTGNSATKTGGVAGWNEQVYIKESYTGGAFASWTANSSNTYLMVGLNNDPTLNASYSSIDYAVYLSASGSAVQIFENRVYIITVGVWTIGDTFAIIYDGYDIKYYRNGTSFYTSTVPGLNKKLYLDSSFYSIGASVKNINFGPLASAPWQGIGSRPAELTDGRITAGLNSGGFIDFYRAHLNKSLLNVDGPANTKLTGIAPLADVTGANTALKIINQGAFATKSSASWSTEITARPVELTDGRITAGLGATGDLVSGLNTSLRTADMMTGIVGPNLSSNPEFIDGTLGYYVYDNAVGGLITESIVLDDQAPNTSGKTLKVSYAGGGTPNVNPTPQFGGILQPLTYAGAGNPIRPTKYVQNIKILFKIIANVPVGRTLNHASNATGNGGAFNWLTPILGTGNWETYVGVRIIGSGGTFSSTGFLYISGGTNVAFDWFIAKYDMTVLNASSSQFINNTLRDSTGVGVTDTSLLNVNTQWPTDVQNRPTELTDGRITAGLNSGGQLAQNLKYSTLMDQGNGVGRTPLVGLETGTARHGDAITFVTPYSSIPSVQWLPSGKTTDTTLIGDAVTSYDALNLTTTGFTASILLKELAGAPAAHTDTLAGASPYDFGIVKTATTPANAWDDTYTFNGFVTVQNIGVSEPGQCLVGLYVLASGTTWVKYGSVTAFGFTGSLTTGRPFSASVTVSGVTNMTGAQFAVMLESSLVPGSVITGFTNVTYSTATAPNSVNAVPVGASPIPYRIFQ